MVRVLKLLIALWALLSALFSFFALTWIRERYGRVGPFPARDAQGLLNPLRSWLHPPGEILARFRVGEGDTVLELGPGPGYFTVSASQMVGPRGKVLCLDLQPEMAAILRARLAERAVNNAHPVAAEGSTLPLAGHSVDKAFLVTVLGEIPDRPQALLELRRVLKPDGVLGFAEYLGDPDYVLMDSLKDLCRASGFEELEERGLPLGYTMTFTAPATAG